MRSPRAWALAFLVVLLLGLAGPAVLSFPVAAGSEAPSVLATAYNTQRKLAATPDGTLYAAAPGGSRQVVYSLYQGGAWSPKVQLSSSPGYAGFPSIAVDARDRVHVAWY